MCNYLQQKPSFELSGKLASETNRVRGEAQNSDEKISHFLFCGVLKGLFIYLFIKNVFLWNQS